MTWSGFDFVVRHRLGVSYSHVPLILLSLINRKDVGEDVEMCVHRLVR